MDLSRWHQLSCEVPADLRNSLHVVCAMYLVITPNLNCAAAEMVFALEVVMLKLAQDGHTVTDFLADLSRRHQLSCEVPADLRDSLRDVVALPAPTKHFDISRFRNVHARSISELLLTASRLLHASERPWLALDSNVSEYSGDILRRRRLVCFPRNGLVQAAGIDTYRGLLDTSVQLLAVSARSDDEWCSGGASSICSVEWAYADRCALATFPQDAGSAA